MPTKIRSIRATDEEWQFIKQCLQSYRAGNGVIETVPPPTPTNNKSPKQVPTERLGISPDDFLLQHGLPPLASDPLEDQPEKDYTEWRADPQMAEIDRGINYEIDSYGYPEIAETISQQFPSLWLKACKAKGKSTTEYNEIMTELWERLNGK